MAKRTRMATRKKLTCFVAVDRGSLLHRLLRKCIHNFKQMFLLKFVTYGQGQQQCRLGYLCMPSSYFLSEHMFTFDVIFDMNKNSQVMRIL